MLKVAIECGYNDKYKAKDLYGAKPFMQEIFKQNDIELVRVSINHYNPKKGVFNEYNIYKSNGIPKRIKKEYKPDIIWNKKGGCATYKYGLLKSFKITCSETISILANDKYETYKFLEKYQPRTFLLSSVFKNKAIQEKQQGEIVLKPIRSNGGRGIKKTTIKELIEEKEKYIGLDELFIIQEFKDFSKGYPGIVEGNHDVRLMFAGKKIVEMTLRVPEEGNFKSNIGSGGKQFPLKKANIPSNLIKLAKKIYIELSPEQKEIFSMDFAFCADEKRRYLLEINAAPGTWYYQTDKVVLKEICIGLVKFFKTM